MRTILIPALLLFPLRPVFAVPPQLIGPFGGSAAVVQIDSRHPGTVIAATSNAMLFRSTDSGDSWTRLPFPAELHGTLHAFTVAPRAGVYAAGLASDNREYSGIFLSKDEGSTWSRSLPEEDIWSIAIWPVDPRVMAAGASDGVFITQDSGEHWSRISPESNPALMPVVSLDFDPADRMILYAGTPHLPWKTTDGGATWQRAYAGMINDSDVFSIHVDLSRHTRVFASACSGLYRSLNQGISWTKLTGATNASYRTYQIAQHPSMLNVLFAGTTKGLVRSMDGGATWRKISPHVARSIAFDTAKPKRLFIATDDAGLLRSDDLGETFRPINAGFCNRHVLALAAIGSTLYASSPSAFARAALFRNAAPGDKLDGAAGRWERLDLVLSWGEQQALEIVPLDPDHLFVLTNKALLLSSDGGRSWTAIGPATTERLTALLVPKAGGRTLFIGTETQIYYTEDRGQTWRQARIPTGQSPIRSLVAFGPRGVAALTGSSVIVSSDGTDYQTAASLAADSEIHALITTDHTDLLAATSRGLEISEDFGASWHAVGGTLDGATVSALCKHPSHPGLLFAARYGSIFSSVDDGRTWEPLTTEAEKLPPIRQLVVAPGIPDTLFAITPAQGVYSIHLDPGLGSTECQNRNCGVIRIQVP